MRRYPSAAVIRAEEFSFDGLTGENGQHSSNEVPGSIAIAGIYGYIGQLIYKAALETGVSRIFGFDPGVRPAGFEYSDRLVMIPSEQQFCELDADLFHIATHPDRRQAVYRLLERGRHVTIEKPMAHPAQPAECLRLREAAQRSSGTVLFDFVEVFNPHSFQIREVLRRLSGCPDFQITQIHCERSKDREDPRNWRNRKVIVPIQYQETAHCLAMLLFVTDMPPSFAEAFPRGITVTASSAPYDPPNPEDYRYGVVDGKVWGELRAGAMNVSICTDFKRRGGKPFKRFCVEGVAGQRPFRIELIFDGSCERIFFNGRAMSLGRAGSRHQDIIRQSWRWHRQRSNGVRPDADFAWLVFGLSSALWASCQEGAPIQIGTAAELQEAMQRYPDAVAKRSRYPALRRHEQVDHGGIVQAPPFCRNGLL